MNPNDQQNPIPQTPTMPPANLPTGNGVQNNPQ